MNDDSAVIESESEVDSSPAPEVESSSPPESSAPVAAESAPKASVWDAFKALPDFKDQDEVAIARRLYESMEREKVATRQLAQYQQYIPYAQQYLQNREPFERWMASQSQAAPPQKASGKAEAAEDAIRKWWNPPEVRESYKQYLVKDENGREVISPDAPLDAKHALYEYQKYKADFAQKFLSDPAQALGPMVAEIAQEQAQRIVAEQFQEVQSHQYVSSVERENADWLYDQNGQPTDEGLAAQRYIEEAAARGIQSPQDRWDYATKMIERDLLDRLRSMQQQDAQKQQFEAGLPAVSANPQHAVSRPDAAPSAPQNATSQAQRDIEFLRREASRNPSKSAGSDDPRAPQAPMTFEQRLARQFKRDGLS